MRVRVAGLEGLQKKIERKKTKWRVKKRKRRRRRGLEMSSMGTTMEEVVVEFSSFVGSQETEGVPL